MSSPMLKSGMSDPEALFFDDVDNVHDLPPCIHMAYIPIWNFAFIKASA